MANHPDIGFGNTQEAGDIRAGLLVVESHDDDRAFAFFQILHTARELFLVEAWHGRLHRRQQIRSKLFQQACFTLRVAAQVQHRHPARSQHKGCELLRLPQAARPQCFQRRDQNLLRKIVRSVFVSQVPQSIQPDARRHPAEQLGFCFAVVSGADLPHQLGILQFNVHHHIFYV